MNHTSQRNVFICGTEIVYYLCIFIWQHEIHHVNLGLVYFSKNLQNFS